MPPCAGLVYPRAPALKGRKEAIEFFLEERCIQVVWAEERTREPGG